MGSGDLGAMASDADPANEAFVPRLDRCLDGAARPLARVLDKLTPSEQEAFLKAMDLLETELRGQDTEH